MDEQPAPYFGSMRIFLALFVLLALVIGPVAPAMAVPVAAEHCTSMGSHHESPASGVLGEHQCCASAMPSLPDRVAEVRQPFALLPAMPSAVVPTLALTARLHIELRPPRTA